MIAVHDIAIKELEIQTEIKRPSTSNYLLTNSAGYRYHSQQARCTAASRGLHLMAAGAPLAAKEGERDKSVLLSLILAVNIRHE